MFRCHVCGGTAATSEFVSEVFTLEGGRRALVEHIPAQVCERCGKTTEKIHLTVQRHEPSEMDRLVSILFA